MKQKKLKMKTGQPIPPKRKWFKELTAKIVFFVLGRAFQSAAGMDHVIRREAAEWPEGFTLMMRILPDGPRMVLEKHEGRLKYRGGRRETADLIINFKNIECAFLVLTPQMGSSRAFAENRLSVVGDLGMAMSFTRCLNMLLTYLYPGFITRRLVKRVPPMTLQMHFNRMKIYLLGIPLGLS